jgi:hypothetical protein
MLLPPDADVDAAAFFATPLMPDAIFAARDFR